MCIFCNRYIICTNFEFVCDFQSYSTMKFLVIRCLRNCVHTPACNARGIMSSGSSTAEQGISKPIGFLGSFGNNLADLRGEYEFENTTDAERGGTPRHR